MNTLTFSNVFDYFSSETGIRESVLREKLRTDGVEPVSELLKSSGGTLYSGNAVLAKTLTDSKGKIKILGSSRPLNRHISLLLGLHKADEKFATSPLVLEMKASALASSGQYITGRISDLITEAAISHPMFGKNAGRIIADEKSYYGLINATLRRLFSSIGGVRDGMRLLNNLREDKELLNNTAAMVTLASSIGFQIQETVKGVKYDSSVVHKFMSTALLFYPLMKFGKRHLVSCRQDKEFDSMLEYCGDITGSGEPFFIKNEKVSSAVKMAVTTHVFINLLEKNKLSASDSSGHILLGYLADAGYADTSVANRLGGLFMPEEKHFSVEFSQRLTKTCVHSPVVWGTSGSGTPLKLLCSNTGCTHATGGRLCVPRDITVKADKVYKTNIKAGEYRSCSKLSFRIEDFFGFSGDAGLVGNC